MKKFIRCADRQLALIFALIVIVAPHFCLRAAFAKTSIKAANKKSAVTKDRSKSKTQTTTKNATKATTKPVVKAKVPRDPFAHLTALEGGPGVVVCEPVVEGGDKAIAQFGAGCGRWLHIAVAGHGELGRSPAWSDIYMSLSGMPEPHLRMAAENAVDLRRTLGATHAVIGQISGQNEQLSLTWRLLDLEKDAAVGEAIVLAGTQTEIMTALPGAARDIVQRLGVKTARVPLKVEATPKELAFLGAVPRVPSSWPSQNDFNYLYQIAEREPLAAVLAWQWSKLPRELLEIVAQRCQGNLVELGMMAWNDGLGMEPFAARWETIFEQFPHNYQVACIDTWRAHWNKKEASARHHAELRVRCAPRNPFAWLGLGDIINAQSITIRQGRFIGQMSPEELDAVGKFYPLWQNAARRATVLDPQNGAAWSSLSQAAVFNGDTIGVSAFWKSVALRPHDAEVLGWGLQMFQPKWLNDPDQLLKVIELALDKKGQWRSLHFGMNSAFKVLDLKQPKARAAMLTYFELGLERGGPYFEKQPGLQKSLLGAWETARQKSGEATAWVELSDLALSAASKIRMGRPIPELAKTENEVLQYVYGISVLAARLATQLNAQDATAWLSLSRASTFVSSGKLEERNAMLSTALTLDPQNPAIYRWGLSMAQPKWGGDASMLWNLVRRVAADSKLLESLAPDVADALQTIRTRNAAQTAILTKALNAIAQLEQRVDVATQRRLVLYYINLRQQDRALPAAEKWVHLAPDDAEAHYQIGGILHNLGNLPGALQQYREAIALDGEHAQALVYAGSILNYQEQFEAAQKFLERATDIAPLWPLPRIYLGEALEGMGRRLEARQQWRSAVNQGEINGFVNDDVRRARKLLETLPAFTFAFPPPIARRGARL